MKKRGTGIATMFYPVGVSALPNPSAAFVRINSDGSAFVYIGAADVGQGSSTVMIQIAAETLGIPFERVTLIKGDTKYGPYDQGTVASRVTYVLGNAVREASIAAREVLYRIACEEFRITPDALVAENGYVYVKTFPEKKLSIIDLARVAYTLRGWMPVGAGSYTPPVTPLDPVTGHGKPFPTYVYATQIAEVEVDTETGYYDVLRIIAVHDCGRAINPLLVEGQIEGGISNGVGYAMSEEMVMKDGKVMNAQFTDYIMPTALDMPEIIVDIVERAEPTGPFGAKGVGEPSLMPTAPAIINAVENAVGVKIRELPLTPEKLFNAMREIGRKEDRKLL
jgi:CO/xanthine dehydrogenase Mo-binding subunit